MSDAVEMVWEDYREKEQRRTVKQTCDAGDYLGTAIYPWLIIAANPHLSAPDIERFLDLQSRTTPGCARSLSWVKRRRWLALRAGSNNRGHLDRNHERALEIMAEHPTASIRSLVLLLKERGITRSREWVRLHRTDGMG